MDVIATQRYYVVSRHIENNIQSVTEAEHLLKLSTDYICCENKDFWIGNVFDISFKSLNNEKGFLYLHTHQGIFSFYVKEDPVGFIKKYKELI